MKRASLAWILVALAGVGVVASFFLHSGDAPAGKAGGGPKVTPVSATKVVRGAITERARYPGELVADAADVAAFYAGRLTAVHVRVGDTVQQDAVLAELDPVDAKQQIAQARAQAKAAAAEEQRARVERDAALREAERLEPLAKDKLISELEIDKQRARAASLSAGVEAAAASGAEARARVDLLERRVIESKVRAPFAGRIAERAVDPGAIVAAGAKLVRLVATSPLRVRFDVPEQDVPSLRVGTEVRVLTKAGGDGALAKVTGIGSEVNRERRVAIAEALIEAPPEGWLPGMYAEAVVARRTLASALLVPAEAVLQRLQPSGAVKTGLFVEQGGVATWTEVVVTARDGNTAAIEGAVGEGAVVLVGGHVDLTDGSKVRVAGTDAKPESR